MGNGKNHEDHHYTREGKIDLKKVQTSLVDSAYEIIKHKILSLDLLPGQIISDFTLYKELEMSRTPIKQALLYLKSDGLIQERDGRGYEVRKITEKDIGDLFDAREGIECTALKIAMNKGISASVIQHIQYMNEAVIAANERKDYEKVFDHDSELHVGLIKASGNTRLIEYYSMILLQLRRMRLLTYFEKELPKEAVIEHTVIFNAIIEKNEKLALEALSRHILGTKQNYIKILRNSIKNDGDFIALKYLIDNNLQIENIN